LVKIYHKFGFLIHGMFIFGYPVKEGISFSMSAKERLKRLKRFIKKARLDTIQVLLPVPLPGTELRERLNAQNRIYSVRDVGWEYYDGNFPVFEPDKPMTAEDTQYAIRKMMGKFYQFKYMFMIGLNIFFFPSIVFFLHDIKAGWRIWYRSWRNSLVRFGGWITFKNWTSKFEEGNFSEKLKSARLQLKK